MDHSFIGSRCLVLGGLLISPVLGGTQAAENDLRPPNPMSLVLEMADADAIEPDQFSNEPYRDPPDTQQIEEAVKQTIPGFLNAEIDFADCSRSQTRAFDCYVSLKIARLGPSYKTFDFKLVYDDQAGNWVVCNYRDPRLRDLC